MSFRATHLYVVIQRLDASYAPGSAYTAVFDTGTNMEVDLDIDSVLKGNPLQTRNPQDVQFVDGLGLVVFSYGRYYPQEFSGGIEVVSLTDYSTSVVVDDGGDYGRISRGGIATIPSPEPHDSLRMA